MYSDVYPKSFLKSSPEENSGLRLGPGAPRVSLSFRACRGGYMGGLLGPGPFWGLYVYLATRSSIINHKEG